MKSFVKKILGWFFFLFLPWKRIIIKTFFFLLFPWHKFTVGLALFTTLVVSTTKRHLKLRHVIGLHLLRSKHWFTNFQADNYHLEMNYWTVWLFLSLHDLAWNNRNSNRIAVAEYTYHCCKNFQKSLSWGTKFIYQALPRLLTLYFSFGEHPDLLTIFKSVEKKKKGSVHSCLSTHIHEYRLMTGQGVIFLNLEPTFDTMIIP